MGSSRVSIVVRSALAGLVLLWTWAGGASSPGSVQTVRVPGPPPDPMPGVERAGTPVAPEGGSPPGAGLLASPLETTFTDDDGFTHWRLEVDSTCQFADHTYTLNLPVDPQLLTEVAFVTNAYDVDDDTNCSGGGGPEVDRVFVNGSFVGILRGDNGTWAENRFVRDTIAPAFPLSQGANAIFIDTDSTGTGCWCVGIGYVELIARVAFAVRAVTPRPDDRNRDFRSSRVDLRVSLTDELDTATLTDTTFKLEYRGPGQAWQQVAGYLATGNIGSFHFGPDEFGFYPSANLKDAVRYRATVKGGPTGVRSKDGGQLAQDYVWSFSTIPDLSLTDAFDYGSGSLCPPAASPCRGLELALFQSVRNKPHLDGKKWVGRVYARWRKHPDVSELDQIRHTNVEVHVGGLSAGQTSPVGAFRPDTYGPVARKLGAHSLNLFSSLDQQPGFARMTPKPQSNSPHRSFSHSMTLPSAGPAAPLRFRHFYLRNGTWSAGIPVGVRPAATALLESGERLMADMFPITSASHVEAGEVGAAYTLQGDGALEDCGTANKALCPNLGQAGVQWEETCAYFQAEQLRGADKFIVVTVNGGAADSLCDVATAFAIGVGNDRTIIFNQHGNGANDGTVAHEIGHVFGISGANNPTPRHRNSSRGVEGFEYSRGRNHSFAEAGCEGAMDECPPATSLMHTTAQPTGERWIHEDDYDDLLFEVPLRPAAIVRPGGPGDGASGAAGAVRPAAGPYLFVAGLLHAGGQAATLAPAFLEDAQRPGGSGPYSVELLDGAGAVVAAASVGAGLSVTLCGPGGASPARRPAEGPFGDYFSASLPWSPSAQALRVRSGPTTLATVSRTAASPVVAFTQPSEGAVLGGAQPIAWTATDADGPAVHSQLQLSEDGGTTFVPLTPLVSGTTHTLETLALPSGPGRVLRLLATDGLNTTFATRGVTIANPLAVSVLPAEGSVGVPPREAVRLSFSSPITAGALAASFLLTELDGFIPRVRTGTLGYDATTRTALFVPDAPWRPGLTYQVRVAGLSDVNGNAIPATVLSSFVAGDDGSPPFLVGRSPEHGSLNVPLNTLVVARFDDALDPASVDGSSFSVAGPAGPVSGSVGYSSPGRQIVFTPAAPLAPATEYTVTATTALRSTDGLSPEGTETWTFTTGTATNPRAVRLLGSFSETVADTNKDGLLESLTVHVDVETRVSGPHNLNGHLVDREGKHLEWRTSGNLTLAPGVHTLALTFSAAAIRSSALDGPYLLDVVGFYATSAPNDAHTRRNAYQTLDYARSDFAGVLSFSGLPDQVVETGTTKPDAFNLRAYTAHATEPVANVTYKLFGLTSPDLGVAIDAAANVDLLPAPGVVSEGEVTVEAKDSFGNKAYAAFHVGIQAAAPSVLAASYRRRMAPLSSQPIAVDVYDQLGRLYTPSLSVGFSASAGSVLPASVPTAGGRAEATLTAPATRGTTFVTLSAGSATNELSIDVVVGGDVTGDGLLDVFDAVTLAGYLVGNVTAGFAPFLAPISAADADLDGDVDLFDLVLQVSCIVGNSTC